MWQLFYRWHRTLLGSSKSEQIFVNILNVLYEKFSVFRDKWFQIFSPTTVDNPERSCTIELRNAISKLYKLQFANY